MSTSSVQAFQHLASAQRVFCGSDGLDMLKRELERLDGTRAAIVCGASLVHEGKTLKRLEAALGSRHAGTIAGAVENSPIPSVLEVARQLQDLRADAVIAAGGGSAIVTARAASIVLAEGHDIHHLCTRQDDRGQWVSPRLTKPKLPQIIVPTTPTTACTKAGSAVLDATTHRRLAMFDPKTRAQAVFVDPGFAATAPASLVLSASMNVFAMAVEGLESPRVHPFSNALLMHTLRLLSGHLPHAIDGATDARCQLIFAAMMCGQGTDFGGAGLASILGHAIGHQHDVANGIINAIVLPHTMRFNATTTGQGTRNVAIGLGASADAAPGIDEAISRVENLLNALPLPHRLRDVGIPESALAPVAETAMTDWFLQQNPRRVRHAGEILAVLQTAW